MQDVSSPEASERAPSALPAPHGPLWLWGLAALVVALSAAIIAAAWMAGVRARAPLPTPDVALELPPGPPAAEPNAQAALIAERTAAAEAGDAVAQYELGLAYLDGIGVPANVDRAIELIRSAAAQEYIPAMLGLGEALASRVSDGSVPPDEVFAALGRVTANPPDSYVLGIAEEYYGRYLSEVVPLAERDPAGAVDHFVAAVAAGNLLVAPLVGDAYRLGEGRPADRVVAYAYYKAAQSLLPDDLGPQIYQLESVFSPDELARAATLTLPVLLAQEPDLSH